MNTSCIIGHFVPSADAAGVPAQVVVEGSLVAAVNILTTSIPQDAPWIIPGLIDAHIHPIETGLTLLFADLSGCSSLVQVQECISDNLARTDGDSPVVLAFNLDPEALSERRYPSRTELDMLCAERPLLVYRIDGHSAAVNSAGLALISDRELDGIEYGTDSRPSGVLRGPAYETASLEFKRRLSADIIREAIVLAGRRLAAMGVTSFGALVGSDELTLAEWKLLVDSLAALPIRAVPYLQSWKPEVARNFGLKQTGGCLLLDGSFGSRTAALSLPYADAPAEHGLLYRSDDQVASYLSRASSLELQTAFHAIGDRAVEQLVRCHEAIGTRKDSLRHRIEHAELLRPDLIEGIRRANLVLVVQPAFEAYWGGPGRLYSARLDERWRNTNPLRTLRAAGIRLAGSSDSPITPADPLAGISAAMNLPNPSQRLTGNEALALFTCDAAFALGIEQRVGTLAPGMAADFVLLDRDPRAGPDCRLLATWCAGRCVHQS
uniref:Amidohydrolase n=1 Tax=candidate division WOR-3 bacterium TaxID=2052148 RepID=A0A7C4CA10_UNCW3